jgi:DNA-binding MarR family transcriptional regulator
MDYTARIINAARSKALNKIGLSKETAGILSAVLRLHNNAMPIEIARYGLRKPQTTTSIINKMVKQGLLIKNVDKNKKNTFRISLTERGKLAHQKMTSLKIYKKIISTVSEEQQNNLEKALNEIKNNAKKCVKSSTLEIDDSK